MKFNLGEINIICTDIERSLHFYQDVLGFEVTTVDDAVAIHLQSAGHPVLLLSTATSKTEAAPYASVPVISFDLYTDDLQVAIEYFQKHGVVIEQSPSDTNPFAVIHDPDGLQIEVIQSEQAS
jgi:catechol 2,3-dioxygenase-like lactoylglutathione lyase family enzyme